MNKLAKKNLKLINNLEINVFLPLIINSIENNNIFYKIQNLKKKIEDIDNNSKEILTSINFLHIKKMLNEQEQKWSIINEKNKKILNMQEKQFGVFNRKNKEILKPLQC